MSVERWRAVGTIVIGGWCVLVAGLRLVNPLKYSAGDYRRDPTFSFLSNGALILIGHAIALYGMRSFLRKSD
jgi:hypothetical protein